MIKRFSKIAGLTIVVVLCMPVVVALAQAEQEQEPVETQVTTMEQPAEDNTTTTTESQTEETRTERIKQYKEKRNQALDTAKQNRIKSRCASAQGKVTSVTARVNQIKANRANAYSQIGQKLDTVIARAEAANVDVSALKTARTDLQMEVDAFSAKLDEYLVTLTDLAEMDCASDPEAFQAALELSRQSRSELAEEAEAIRKLVKEDIKALLAELRIKLAQARAENNTLENPNSSESTQTGDQ